MRSLDYGSPSATLAVDFQTPLNDGVSTVARFVPKLFAFLVILIIGFIVAKVLAKVVNGVLERVGFDNAVERGGIKTALAKTKYDASDILAKLVYYAVMLFVLSTAFGVFGPNPISGYLSAIITYLPLVFVAIIIVVIASAIAAAAKLLIEGSLGALSYGKMLANAASTLIIALGVIAALNQLHIATNVVNAVLYAFLAAIIGVVVVAVGGGGISAMKPRWESALNKLDQESSNVSEQVKQSPSAADQARHAARQAQSGTTGSGSRDI